MRAVKIVVPAFCALLACTASARIKVHGDTLTFTPSPGASLPAGEAIRKVLAFEQEMRVPEIDMDVDQPQAAALREVLRRRVLQGLRFVVSPSERFAVIMSYHCTMPELGAEFPFGCNSSLVVVDADGRVIGTSKGNYFHLQVHDTRPYFLVAESTCCDAPVPATVFGLDGRAICTIDDHRDSDWVERDTIRCRPDPDEPEQTIRLDDEGD